MSFCGIGESGDPAYENGWSRPTNPFSCASPWDHEYLKHVPEFYGEEIFLLASYERSASRTHQERIF